MSGRRAAAVGGNHCRLKSRSPRPNHLGETAERAPSQTCSHSQEHALQRWSPVLAGVETTAFSSNIPK